MKKLLFVFLIIVSAEAKAQDDRPQIDRIYAREAGAYIGKQCKVTGTIFKVDIKKNQPKQNHALVILHLTDLYHCGVDFIILIKVLNSETGFFFELLKKGLDGCEGTGKIFLYKGHPAINIKGQNDFKILLKEPVN